MSALETHYGAEFLNRDRGVHIEFVISANESDRDGSIVPYACIRIQRINICPTPAASTKM